MPPMQFACGETGWVVNRRKPRIGDTVRTTRAIPATPWVPSGVAAVVTAMSSGRYQIQLIGMGGNRYWCDLAALEVAS
jgi:hypothetical protein